MIWPFNRINREKQPNDLPSMIRRAFAEVMGNYVTEQDRQEAEWRATQVTMSNHITIDTAASQLGKSRGYIIARFGSLIEWVDGTGYIAAFLVEQEAALIRRFPYPGSRL